MTKKFMFGLGLIMMISVALISAAQPAGLKNLAGQIAYVKGGEIYIHDLNTQSDIRITHSGNNRSPDWSYDGQYLLYIHGPAETANLIVLDQDWKEAASFPARAGGWAYDTHEIFWITRGDDNFFRSGIDGKNPEVVFDITQKSPSENWDDFSIGELNIIVVSRRSETHDGTKGYFRQLDRGWESYYETYLAPRYQGQSPEMCMFSADISRATGAWAFTIDTGCMLFAPGAEGIYVSDPEWRYLTVYGGDPDWSPDAQYLAYRYMAMCESGLGMCHAGIAVVELCSDDVRIIVEDPEAQQPAWRPMADSSTRAIAPTPTRTVKPQPTDVSQDILDDSTITDTLPAERTLNPSPLSLWQKIVDWFRSILFSE